MKTKMLVSLDSTFLLKEILIFIMSSKGDASFSIFPIRRTSFGYNALCLRLFSLLAFAF